MTGWVVSGLAVGVVGALVGWVAWRDRERVPSAEDGGAAQAALRAQQRHEGARHVSQSDLIRRGEHHQ